MLFISGFMATTTVLALPTTGTKGKKAMKAGVTSDMQITSVDEFLALTPKIIEETTGVKLNFFQKMKLKTSQKVMGIASGKAGSKSQLVALILVLLVGVIGVHRFYLGYIGIGIIQLLTFGAFGIWTLIDLILIITGKLTPKNGSYDSTF